MTSRPTLESSLRPNDDVLFQELQGESVLLNLKTGVYFGLDAVGTRVWELLDQPRPLSDVLDVLVREYEVTNEQCEADLLSLAGDMLKHELVTLG